MAEYKLGEIEMRFADIIWNNEPLSSGELVKLCAEELSWKKSTTYTILRRVCERGLFQNKNGTVTSLVSKEEFRSMQSEKFIDDTFAGSLPKFLTAFTRRKRLSEKEIAQLQQIIAESQGNNTGS
ncbi:MAG TPA: BlaI/MecI/CopY family transcriptional regulator [Lachnospiraceae bacterium]|nr:BlaI/MecI/CopY family transcriptional regulator [Lachnospiraceae bacterium]